MVPEETYQGGYGNGLISLLEQAFMRSTKAKIVE